MLIPIPDTYATLGMSRSQFYAEQRLGLIPRSVKIGERAAALPDDEIDLVRKAKVAGLSTAERKALVVKIHAKREQLATQLRRDFAL